jgi:hypothetical protein
MGLVDGIGKLVAELVEDGLNSGVVACGDELADDPLESICQGERELAVRDLANIMTRIDGYGTRTGWQ